MQEGETVRIFVGLERRIVHQCADREVGHQESVELLTHQIGRLAAQDDFGAAQVGFAVSISQRSW